MMYLTRAAIVLGSIPQIASAQTLVHTHMRPVHPDSVVVAFFADGSVKNAIDNEDLTRPTGAVGLALATSRHDITVLMNVASSNEPQRHSFGSSLLVPAVGTGSGVSAALMDVRIPDGLGQLTKDALPRFLNRIDLHIYGSLSSTKWALDPYYIDGAADAPTETTDDDSVVSVATVGVGLLMYRDFLHQVVGDNSISVGGEVGFAYRRLFGDIATQEENAFKKAALRTPDEKFYGFELGIYLQVSSVKAGAAYYFFDNTADVPGLSDGQVVVALSAQADVFTSTAVRRRSRREAR
ncbi:MAG TPA: hypothetical protein VFQ45_01930 [Longimicrobium sp.]|nr:hypothetical protein [Longimicrobium sp.]